jgi:hypothetical protein
LLRRKGNPEHPGFVVTARNSWTHAHGRAQAAAPSAS